MKTLKKENKVFAYHEASKYGEYIKDDERYTVVQAREIYAPDNADLSMWVECDSVQDYVDTYMKGFEHNPLTEDEIKEMEEAERKKLEEENSN